MYIYSSALSLAALTAFLGVYAENGITYSFTGARFGDNITAYIGARWIGYSKGIPFYYRPFEYSDLLVMHDSHKPYEGHGLSKEIFVRDAPGVDISLDDTMFVMHPFPRETHLNYDDANFMALLRNEIRPKKMTSTITIPEGHRSVALHIRRGGGYDSPLWQNSAITNHPKKPEDALVPEKDHVDKQSPTRIPPDIWYIQMLQYIRKYYPAEPLYVYIFTDDPKPQVFADLYAEALNDPLITFDYCRVDNRHDNNVLEDFFAMMQFECVIRADSWFSEMACRIGRPKIELTPNVCRWEDRKLVVTEVWLRKRHDVEGSYASSSERLHSW